MRLGITCITVLLLALSAPAAVITFESFPIGTRTPFSDTEAGFDVNFSSPGGDVFTVGDWGTVCVGVSGHVLINAGLFPEVLNVTFSRPLASASLSFVLNTQTDDVFILTALSGGISGTSIGSATATAVVPSAETNG